MLKNGQRGTVLFMVLGFFLLVVILANLILNLTLSQARLTHHEISRTKAYYAASGVMNYALEMLRTGTWKPNSPGEPNKYACFPLPKGCIDSVLVSYELADDPDIPYKVQVTIYPFGTGTAGTARLDIKTDYTYQD